MIMMMRSMRRLETKICKGSSNVLVLFTCVQNIQWVKTKSEEEWIWKSNPDLKKKNIVFFMCEINISLYLEINIHASWNETSGIDSLCFGSNRNWIDKQIDPHVLIKGKRPLIQGNSACKGHFSPKEKAIVVKLLDRNDFTHFDFVHYSCDHYNVCCNELSGIKWIEMGYIKIIKKNKTKCRIKGNCRWACNRECSKKGQKNYLNAIDKY